MTIQEFADQQGISVPVAEILLAHLDQYEPGTEKGPSGSKPLSGLSRAENREAYGQLVAAGLAVHGGSMGPRSVGWYSLTAKGKALKPLAAEVTRPG